MKRHSTCATTRPSARRIANPMIFTSKARVTSSFVDCDSNDPEPPTAAIKKGRSNTLSDINYGKSQVDRLSLEKVMEADEEN